MIVATGPCFTSVTVPFNAGVYNFSYPQHHPLINTGRPVIHYRTMAHGLTLAENRVASLPESTNVTYSHMEDLSDGSDSYSEKILVSLRKQRKRPIIEASDHDEDVTIPATLPPLSRIKRRKKLSIPSPAQDFKETALSNGKIVDGKSSFATLDVAPWLIASLAAMAIQRPTAIQKACIPEILAGKDIIGGSRTGSGKTVAFAVPILQKWAEDPLAIFAVVLTPTR